jgi:hypothetical protein
MVAAGVADVGGGAGDVSPGSAVGGPPELTVRLLAARMASRDRQRDIQHAWIGFHLSVAQIGVRGANLRDPGNCLRDAGAAAGAFGRDLRIGILRCPQIEERVQ